MRRVLQAGAVLYVAAWVVTAFLPIEPTDLDAFFWPSVRQVLHGHPLLVYQPGGQAAYPNANGPLALVPLSAVGFALQSLGWMGDIRLRRALALPVAALFLILMAREGVRAIERGRGVPLTGRSRVLAYAAFTLAPPAWQSVAGYGHFEQPIEMWLVLLSVRWLDEKRAGLAGLAGGLAILARTSALLVVAPLLMWSWWRGRRASATARGVFASGVAVLGLVPFLVADRADVVHSLFTYRGDLEIGAGSFWAALSTTSLAGFGQHWDGVLVVAGALALAALASGRGDRWSAMLLSALSFDLLAKTVWPYYFFEVYVLAVVWAGLRQRVRRAAVVPAALAGLGVIAEIGSARLQARDVVLVEGLGMAAALAALAAAILWSAWSSRSPGGLSPTHDFQPRR